MKTLRDYINAIDGLEEGASNGFNIFQKEVEKPSDSDNSNNQASIDSTKSSSDSFGTDSNGGATLNGKPVYAMPATKPGDKRAPTGGHWSDIENQYALNPNSLRVARDWKDGTPGLTPDGRLINSYTQKEVPQDVLHIEARKGWDKLMTNFDGTPILAGDRNTRPKEPDHPYYHVIYTSNNERFDPYRTAIINILEKDPYGYQRRDYNDSGSPIITWSIPSGFSSGGEDKVKKFIASTGGSLDPDACYQDKHGNLIYVQRQSGHNLAGSMTADIVNTANTLDKKEYEQGIKGLKVKHIDKGLTVQSAVGKWFGQAVRASGAGWGNDIIRADLSNQISAMANGTNPQTDLYAFFYLGSPDHWASSGKSAYFDMVQSTKYSPGFAPMQAKSMNEELSRIVNLARQ